MLPDRDVEEPSREKKCNDDYPQNRQNENSADSTSMSVFIVHLGGALSRYSFMWQEQSVCAVSLTIMFDFHSSGTGEPVGDEGGVVVL